MSVIRDYDRFWMDTDETGQKKPIGWDTLTEDAAEEEGEGGPWPLAAGGFHEGLDRR